MAGFEEAQRTTEGIGIFRVFGDLSRWIAGYDLEPHEAQAKGTVDAVAHLGPDGRGSLPEGRDAGEFPATHDEDVPLHPQGTGAVRERLTDDELPGLAQPGLGLLVWQSGPERDEARGPLHGVQRGGGKGEQARSPLNRMGVARVGNMVLVSSSNRGCRRL